MVDEMVPSAGVEPATFGLEDQRSVQLSYEGKWYTGRESNPQHSVPKTDALSS